MTEGKPQTFPENFNTLATTVSLRLRLLEPPTAGWSPPRRPTPGGQAPSGASGRWSAGPPGRRRWRLGGIKLRCPRCGHEWTYRGQSRWWATCPICRRLV